MPQTSYQKQYSRAVDPEMAPLGPAYKDLALHAETLERNAEAQADKRNEPADDSVER